MSPPSRALALAATISEATQQIEQYRQSQGLPALSLGADAPADISYPLDIENHRQALIGAAQELKDLAMGPRDLTSLPGWSDIGLFSTSRAINSLNIPQKIPATGDISYDDLSALVGVPSGILRQTLRAAMGFHHFCEPRPGYVAHTATTKLWAQGQGMQDWVGFCTEDWVPSALYLDKALKQHPNADDPADSAYMVAKGSGESSMYAYFEKHPEEAQRFARVMTRFQTGEGYSVSHLTDNYRWSALEGGTVVDLGGSTGAVAFALAERYPSLRLMVQDLPTRIASATPQQGKNVSFMAHNFFDEQPVKGGDVYLFRWILHNWPDAYVHRILRALIPALKSGSKIIIMDEIMPSVGSLPLSVERCQRTIDFAMLTFFNSKLREIEDWKEVVTEADRRFQIASVVQPENSRLGIIEVEWHP